MVLPFWGVEKLTNVHDQVQHLTHGVFQDPYFW